jgi:Smg protein
MFDILVYLFENYVHAGACPESDQLARKLSAAGFEDEEITEALEWLSGLRGAADTVPLLRAPRPDSTRVYAADEQAKLDSSCRGFLTFLENADALDPATRERIIERTVALAGFNVNLHRFKLIVLMVMWQQEQPLDSLILDELLADEGEEELALLH